MTRQELKVIATAIRNLQIDGIDLGESEIRQVAEQFARELAPICKKMVPANFVEDCLPDDGTSVLTWDDVQDIKVEPTAKIGD